MSISRISTPALGRILNKKVKNPISCFIKFYSNSCPFCVNLKPFFHDVADKFENEQNHFYAFNISDDPSIAKKLKYKGVPTIVYINTGPSSKIEVLSDPSDPDEDLFYHPNDILDFVKRNLSDE